MRISAPTTTMNTPRTKPAPCLSASRVPIRLPVTLAAAISSHFAGLPAFAGIEAPVGELAAAARIKTETLRTDADIFDVWSTLVTAGERLVNFGPQPSLVSDHTGNHNIIDGLQLIRQGRDLINYIARARTPMPKSTRDFIARCDTYVKTGHAPLAPAGLPV